jgi:hypothetical protein
METKGPNFFIVGAPKCGTTSLAEYLKQHPEIFMSEPKEPHFFGTDLESLWGNRFERYRDIDTYLALFVQARDEKRIGEASPWYLYSKRAADEIKKFNPSSRIIIMLRNPVDMVYSLHGQQLYNGNEDIVDFEAALDAEPDRRNGRRMPKTAHNPVALLYTDVASYCSQVQRYFDVFDREQILLIFFDDFVSDTKAIYREVLEFLDVDPDYQCEFEVHNPAKAIHSIALWRFLMIAPTRFSIIKRMIPRVLRRTITNALVRFNVREAPRPPMRPERRSRLKKVFSAEVERLGALLGRDLSYWCQDESLVDSPEPEAQS